MSLRKDQTEGNHFQPRVMSEPVNFELKHDILSDLRQSNHRIGEVAYEKCNAKVQSSKCSMSFKESFRLPSNEVEPPSPAPSSPQQCQPPIHDWG